MAEQMLTDPNKFPPTVKVLYDYFMEITKGDKQKTFAGITSLSQKVQEDGAKLVHFGDVVFLVTVSGPHMIEMHAMIGGKPTEAEKMKELDTQLDKLLKYLKTIDVKLAYTYMAPNMQDKYSKILNGYKFKKSNIKGPDGKPYVAFYVEV